MTPLYIACYKGHVDVVRLLVEAEEGHMNKARDDGAIRLH